MSAPVRVCVKHQTERTYYPRQKKYRCLRCREEERRRADPDKRREYRRRYYLANTDKARGQNLAWRKAHPDKAKAIECRARIKYRHTQQFREHERYYKRSIRLTQRLVTMSDPCAILRDI